MFFSPLYKIFQSSLWMAFFGLLALLPQAVEAAPPSSIEGLEVIKNESGQVTHYKSPSDKIPALCSAAYGNPTHVSAKNGNWSDSSIWNSSSVPAAGARVHIAPGTTVTYDVESDAIIDCIEVQDTAHLIFSTLKNTKLALDDSLYVLPGINEGGKLTIGTSQNPIPADKTATIIFADTPLKTGTVEQPGPDPQQYGKAVHVWGQVTWHGAVKNPTFVRIADEIKAGQSSITLFKPVSGWRAGDTIFIPESRQVRFDEKNPGTMHNEEKTLASVSADKKTLTFTTPVQWDHPCAKNNDDTRARVTNVDANNSLYGEPLCPHAVDITRNILLAPANPNGNRAHTMTLHHATSDVRYVEFRDMDRTRAQVLDNTTFDATGKVTHIGTNQIGRYSLHLHHLSGPANSTNTGYQYQAIGNSFNGGRKWLMTVHNSHWGLVSNNVFKGGAGAPLATESGQEIGNIIEHNFVGGMTKEAADIPFAGIIDGYSGSNGFGMWFGGPFNTIRENVVSSSRRAHYALYPPSHGDPVNVPKFRGADTTKPENVESKEIRYFGFTEFARNEAYGYQEEQAELLDWWDFGRKIPPDDIKSGIWPAFARNVLAKPDAEPILIESMIAWHYSERISNNYPRSGYEIFDRLLIRGANIGAYQDGPSMEDNGQALKTEVRNSDIQGISYGVWNQELSYLMEVIGGSISPKDGEAVDGGNGRMSIGTHTILRNVLFPVNPRRADPRPTVQAKLEEPAFGLHTFTIYDFNQRAGDNLQIFYPEQSPDFVILPTNTNIPSGHPCPGLTNRQCWEQYGQAIFGQIASCTTNTRASDLNVLFPARDHPPGRQGFVCPLVAPSASNLKATVADPDSTITLGPVGYWKFDEGTGQTVSDSVGSYPALMKPDGFSPAWTNDAAPTKFANPNSIKSRPGTYPYITKSYYDQSGYSYSFWVKAPAGPSEAVFTTLKLTSTGGFAAPYLTFNRANDKLLVNMQASDERKLINQQTSQAIVFDDQWHHVVWTDQAGKGKLYIDGRLDAGNFSYFTHWRGGVAVEDQRNFNAIRIFASNITPAVFDDLRAFNRVLASHEVADLAAGNLGDVSQVLTASEQITWESPNFANFYVHYGLDTSYTNRSPRTTQKTRTLTGLLPNTTYHYRVCGEHAVADGNLLGCSPDATFTTATTGTAPAKLIITSPESGATLPPGDVVVKYTTSGDLASVNADHAHCRLDGGNEAQDTAKTGTFTFPAVAEGPHTLTCYLATASHVKVPDTDVSLSFTVQSTPPPNGAPTLTIKDAQGNVVPNNATISATIGQLLKLTFEATDAEGDPITITIPNLNTLFPGGRLE